MEFQKSVITVIKERTSCRSYDAQEIDRSTLQKLNAYLMKLNAETKTKTRFLFAAKQQKSDGSSEKLGTYGMIAGARSFLVGVVDKSEKDELEFGYLFEKIVLFATDLGLQTCWLGGTFSRSNFDQISNLSENEFIPIVSPIGIKKEKRRMMEAAVRAVIGADKRKPWSQLFFSENRSTPLSEESAGIYRIPLEMVRIGPSASNKQPWRIIKDQAGYHFYLCRTKGYGSPHFDMQKNDLGIAMCHFELTAKELGLSGTWEQKGNISSPAEWEYITTWSVSD